MILHLLQITCSSSTQLATMFPARSHRKVLILGGNLLESRNLLVFISQMIASFQIYSVTPKNYDFSDQMKSHVSVSPSFWKLMLCLITMGSSVWKKSVAMHLFIDLILAYPCQSLTHRLINAFETLCLDEPNSISVDIVIPYNAMSTNSLSLYICTLNTNWQPLMVLNPQKIYRLNIHRLRWVIYVKVDQTGKVYFTTINVFVHGF